MRKTEPVTSTVLSPRIRALVDSLEPMCEGYTGVEIGQALFHLVFRLGYVTAANDAPAILSMAQSNQLNGALAEAESKEKTIDGDTTEFN